MVVSIFTLLTPNSKKNISLILDDPIQFHVNSKCQKQFDYVIYSIRLPDWPKICLITLSSIRHLDWQKSPYLQHLKLQNMFC